MMAHEKELSVGCGCVVYILYIGHKMGKQTAIIPSSASKSEKWNLSCSYHTRRQKEPA